MRENPPNENLFGVAIRCGQDRPDEYGKTDGQEVKLGVITTTPIIGTVGKPYPRLLIKEEAPENNAKLRGFFAGPSNPHPKEEKR